MNIILVSSRLARAVTLGPRQIVLVLAGAFLLVASFAFVLGGVLAPATSKMPLLRLMPGAAAKQAEIDALAVRLGELQAKLLRLDGVARQVGAKTGIDVGPFLSDQPVPRGGAAGTGQPLSFAELQWQMTDDEQRLAGYQDQLVLAESVLMLPSFSNLPVLPPVSVSRVQSSSFGVRIDPFSGRQSFHEGIDYLGNAGDPIRVAGGGTVIYAAYHAEYGNMVDVDHGNGLVSRYAHNSRLNVREGDKVAAGQVIALLGSSGRSTGAHLHFEIRYKNVPQNPLRFLGADTVAGKAVAVK